MPGNHYYDVMGCNGSHHYVDNGTENGKSYKEGHRFSNCNGRITRIVQDDQIDYCEDDSTYQHRTELIDNSDVFYRKNFKSWIVHGKWICGISAGGSRNNIELFASNPQFELEIGYTYDYEKNVKVPILISLKQNNFENNPSHIALYVYKNENPGTSLNAEYFLCVPPIEHTGAFRKKETIIHEAELKPNTYIIIPAEFHAHHDKDFTLTVTILKRIPAKLRQLQIATEPIVYYNKN